MTRTEKIVISKNVVEYQVATGQVLVPNPMPVRAVQTRTSSKDVASLCGLGRINWNIVKSYTNRDILDFCDRLDIGHLLQGNAKTEKPRPSGRLGVIKGLSLAPHFYANMLNLVGVYKSGALKKISKEWFYSFDGRTKASAAEFVDMSESELLNLCAGSSKYCRQTCLVTTGQHPSTLQAAHAKMKFTNALLTEPELFVATLCKQLRSFAKSAAKNDMDAIVRLNMLSDIPWYDVCPEIFEEFEGKVYFYDYTKNPFWRSAGYKRVEHLLDLTYSYSGQNDRTCVEALNNGYRVAVAFAPADRERSTSVSYRTTWKEITNSGLLDENNMVTDLFGADTGEWLMVDGDRSDYRIDDPSPCIVALNFKQPNVKADTTSFIEEALAESRARFAKHVPDVYGFGEAYVQAMARRKMWKDIFGKNYKEHLAKLEAVEVLDLAQQYDFGDHFSEFDAMPDSPEVSEDIYLPMFPVEGTGLLAGPHVPTVLND